VQEGLRSRRCATKTTQVAYWYEEGGHYVDVDGNRFELPPDTRSRVVTRLDYADDPVAAIVHDAACSRSPSYSKELRTPHASRSNGQAAG